MFRIVTLEICRDCLRRLPSQTPNIELPRLVNSTSAFGYYLFGRATSRIWRLLTVSASLLCSLYGICCDYIGEETNDARAINLVLHQLVQLHFTICSEFLEKKIFPHVAKRDALSLAVPTRSAVDVNLKLFE